MHRIALLPLVALALAGFGVSTADARGQGPRVIVSIKPVHAIVAAVMERVAAPDLIIKGAGSPHTYAMRPSEARRLNDAQLVFWVGENLETFLRKPLSALAGSARVITLMNVEGLTRFPTREGGARQEHQIQAREGGEHDGLDVHVWLDSTNAKLIAKAAAAALGEVDPTHRATYAANVARFIARVDALDAELRAALEPVKDVPFVALHDAYQYVERRYGLNAIGSVVAGPERRPGAKRLQEIRTTISELDARCLFSEPQFNPALVQIVVEGTDAKTAVLDPLGAELTPGPDAYFALMRNLARALRGCLAGDG